VQLGELQHQIERFNRRGVQIVAISVDQPQESLALLDRLGITFHIASDPKQEVVKAFEVQNPDTQELALHAVYIVNKSRQIIYRKVASRRPTSNELIDAIDAHRGQYPQNDAALPRRLAPVAYPTNNFQALLEASRPDPLPKSIDADHFERVAQLIRNAPGDDALIAYRGLMRASTEATLDELLTVASVLAQQLFFSKPSEALDNGAKLRQRLNSVSALEAQLTETLSADERDQLLDKTTKARALLSRSRAIISNNAQAWRLRRVKTSIRAYREVARAAYRARSATAKAG